MVREIHLDTAIRANSLINQKGNYHEHGSY